MLPLDGLLVIALEQAVAAPLCTQRLADAGARVIKIERIGGETARHYDTVVNGTSAYFATLNRGKESCELNIKEPEDRALLESMVAKADVFVRNIAPGAAARLGLDAKELVKKYPRLICLDIFGYGQETTYAKRLAYDMLVQAESGLCAITGTTDEAVKVGASVADLSTGATAYTAILEALMERAITGKGKAIETLMFNTVAEMMNVPLAVYDFTDRVTPRMGLAHSIIAPYGKFSCKDGDLVVVCQQHSEWVRLCEGVLQHPELVDDPRFVTNPDRVKNVVALSSIITEIFATQTQKELVLRLEAQKLPWANVSTMPDLSNHPALQRIEIDTPNGPAKIAASPVRKEIKSLVLPKTGEHNAKIRAEFNT